MFKSIQLLHPFPVPPPTSYLQTPVLLRPRTPEATALKALIDNVCTRADRSPVIRTMFSKYSFRGLVYTAYSMWEEHFDKYAGILTEKDRAELNRFQAYLCEVDRQMVEFHSHSISSADLEIWMKGLMVEFMEQEDTFRPEIPRVEYEEEEDCPPSYGESMVFFSRIVGNSRPSSLVF
ncbi:hypothetical protein BDQ17DRAFT_1350558 [Cyathus striatus]|nr:hypothetical protein BDQ17DRAFT_1350558 [Cyathus striatus]